MYFKTKPAKYFQYIRLLFDGGRLVLCGLLKKVLSDQELSLQNILTAKYSELTGKIEDEELLKQLCPNDNDMTKFNLETDNWDIAVLACVIISVLNDRGDSEEDVISDVTTILEARRSYAESALIAVDNEKFTNASGKLLSSISYLRSALDPASKKKCKKIIANFNEPQRNENDDDEKYFESLKSHGSAIKSLIDIYNEKCKTLKELASTMEENDIPFLKYHILDLKIVTLGNDEEKKKVVDDILAIVWQAALDKSESSSDFATVRQSLDLILDDLRRIHNVEVENIELHCILLFLKCKSWGAIFHLVEYFESPRFKQHLQNVSIELSLIFDETITIQGHLTVECLLEISNLPPPYKFEGDIDGRDRTLNVPIKCSSVRGMREVLKVLGGEQTTNRLNEISDTLSHAEGKITLKVFPDVYGFKGVFGGTDFDNPGPSILSDEEELDDVSSGKRKLEEQPYIVSDSFSATAEEDEAKMKTSALERQSKNTEHVTNTNPTLTLKAENDRKLEKMRDTFGKESPFEDVHNKTQYKDTLKHSKQTDDSHKQSVNTRLEQVEGVIPSSVFSEGTGVCSIRNRNLSHDQWSLLSSSISQQNLHELIIDNVSCTTYGCEGHHLNFSKHLNLKSISLFNCMNTYLSDINPHLESCDIKGVTGGYSHEIMLSLSSGISHAVKLKMLRLDELRCSKYGCEGHVIDLSTHDKLQNLTLSRCDSLCLFGAISTLLSCEIESLPCSHEIMSFLSASIACAVKLEMLKLDNIHCSNIECEGHAIDLSKHKKLKNLVICRCRKLYFKTLKSASCLDLLVITDCRFSHEQWRSFSSRFSGKFAVNFARNECARRICRGHNIKLSGKMHHIIDNRPFSYFHELSSERGHPLYSDLTDFSSPESVLLTEPSVNSTVLRDESDEHVEKESLTLAEDQPQKPSYRTRQTQLSHRGKESSKRPECCCLV